MVSIKKSFNLEADTAQLMDNFIQLNPGVSATLIFNQAIKSWLKNPVVQINHMPTTTDDVDKFLAENSDLMDKLAK